MKRSLVIGLIVGLLMSGTALANSPVAEIDKLHNAAQTRIYGLACDQQAVDMHLQCFRLAEEALKADPNNYELLWRAARASALFNEAINDVRPEGWQQLCKDVGKAGLEYGNRAVEVDPQRVDAYFWRTYAIGGYRYGLGNGLEGIVAAIREGFLEKAQTNAEKAYELDKTFMGYTPNYAYVMFLANIPAFVRVKPYGGGKARLEKAVAVYDEFAANISDDRAQYQELAFQWDVVATYAADFLIKAVDKVEMDQAQRQKYLADARFFCEIVVKECNRPAFVKWARELLDDPGNWS